MTTFRYWLALVVLTFAPGTLLFWFSLHPFVDFWRKLGTRLTLVVHYGAILVLGVVVFQLRRWLLAVDYGTHGWVLGLGIGFWVLSVVLRSKLPRRLSTQVLTGLPELDPGRSDNLLLTEGLYRRVRHPRYVQLFLAVLGYTLMANFLASYLVFGLCLLMLPLMVRTEERELLQRFGEAYESYCKEVPRRFVPRWRLRGPQGRSS